MHVSSISININGRSLYIVDRRMVVVGGGNVLHHAKNRKLSGNGKRQGGNMSGGNVRILMQAAADRASPAENIDKGAR